jgi:hypothetical protein
VFVYGAVDWREHSQWPPPEAEERVFYLRSGGRANGLPGDGELTADEPAGESDPDRFCCDPEDPVRSLGDSRRGAHGPADQRPLEARADVLCYTTPPLAADVEVLGPARLILFAASSGSDGDFAAKLVDVAPDGTAVNRGQGIVRARWQTQGAEPVWFQGDSPRTLEIDFVAARSRFRSGHRLRLEIAASNFPCFDRNPNTRDDPEAAPPEQFTASRQTVFHDANHPSRLVLCVAGSRAAD